MAKVSDLCLRMDSPEWAAAKESLAALVDAGRASERAEVLFHLLAGFLASPMDTAAVGAGVHIARPQPDERYLELVAAAASELNRDVVTVHGWPILSIVGDTSIVAEAGEVTSLPGRGLHS